MTLATSLRPGYRLGRYECLVPLGQGGMAAVWAARVRGARGFQKVVALKVMLPTLAVDNQRDHEAMFYDEARIASQIRHPNVVETFDLGEEEGSLFIAMELLEGESLSQLCRLAPSGLLPLPAALRTAIDACAGLHAAHTLTDEQGTPLTVVHRDVTPHNLFVTRHGVTKVTDFGIAKAFGKSSQETRTGVLKGKIAYMAPEQLGNARPVDARSDIFSLGVSLYQMTTGVHPFHAQTLGETVARVLGNALEPPSRAVGWRYPPGLEAVLMRALAPDPDARFPSAEAFGEALDAVARREVGLASARDVASLLEVTAGASLRKRSEALRQALEMAKARADQSVEIGALASVPAGLLSPPAATPTPTTLPTPTLSNNVAPADLGSKVSFHRSLVVSLPPPKRRWPVAALVGVGLLAPAFGATAAHFWAGPAGLQPLPAARGAASATALGARPAPAADRPEGTAAFVAPPEDASPSSSPPSAAPREAPGKEAGRDATKTPPKAPPPPPPPRRNGGRPGEAPSNPGGGAVPVRDPGF